MNAKVDEFLKKEKRWHVELGKLRQIVLECGLTEDMKWGHPCYTLDGRNIAIIHGFKEYCAILFVKGALLNDPEGLLIRQTENVQAGRQIRFTDVREISKLERTIKAYILEAIEIEKAGLKVGKKKTSDFAIPVEFQRKLDELPALRAAFEALTPGRQRAYLYHFAQPKQSATRVSRVEKYIPKILDGLGMDD
jgi:uncharacterized protein YdeI (YjbR/CyaY-like superfamily)